MLLAAPSTAISSATAAPATCQGKVATINVDSPDGVTTAVPGTASDDVISTTGSVEIEALAGDDVICMETGYVNGGDGTDAVQVQGSDAREFLDVRFAEDLDLSLGGGRDSVVLIYSSGGAGVVRGGSGADSVIVASRQSVRADLRQHHLSIDETGSYDLRGFEEIQATGRAVTLKGDDRGNALSGLTSACRITIKGRGGKDDLRVHGNGLGLVPQGGECRNRSTRMLGGGGNDHLRGGLAFNDTLLGGPGRDTADGRDGFDTCRAEVRRRCER
ncbi:hypothetical protein [Nocardioides sp.]|uniref:hypothetical protein n=1 Tax=Nocardioides sp. TaxID=35761 RepID=UPI001A2B7DFB|nr:hypothetical protein [Nocardioides sp.]MBJ7358976.1 hypothetical protein [Nocardioides sp.]